MGEANVRFASEIAHRFALAEDEERILGEQVPRLDRRSRRLYHARIEPRAPEFLAFLRAELRRTGAEDAAGRWAVQIGANVAVRGYATIAEQLAMEVIGRAKVSEVVRMLRAGGPPPG